MSWKPTEAGASRRREGPIVSNATGGVVCKASRGFDLEGSVTLRSFQGEGDGIE